MADSARTAEVAAEAPRAAPPQFYSEYRSTYRWHEFSKPQSEAVVKRPPQPTQDEFLTFCRKKKHPELAYRSHEFFDPSLAAPFPARDIPDGASASRQSRSRRAATDTHDPAAHRRARSEGPVHRRTAKRMALAPVTNASDVDMTKSAFSIHTGGKEESGEKMVRSMVTASEASKSAAHNGGPKQQLSESVSMGQIPHSQAMANTAQEVSASEPKLNEEVVRRPREARSEYRVKYRPFSQYEYLDGHFIASPGAASPPEEVRARQQQALSASLHGEPWYKEVVELRKQANDYRCRGWGADLASPHLSDLYHKQLELYEQTRRRESLSALALAIAAPRPFDSTSSVSSKIRPSPARPGTAPPSASKLIRADSAQRGSEASSTATARGRKPVSTGSRGSRSTSKSGSWRPPSAPALAAAASTSASVSASTDHAAAVGGWRIPGETAPVKRQRPTTLNTSASSSLRPASVSASASVGPRTPRTTPHDSASAKQPPPQLHLVRPSASGERGRRHDVSTAAVSRGSPDSVASRPHAALSSRASTASRPASAIADNHLDYFREPVVKSPPEPTRVRSPEGCVRSPDPINWTVPLDTGKTFSVTQGLKNGESARESPVGDPHHLDSVSGTAISLGRGAGSAATSTSSKISSLAREARAVQPGLTKDSTVTLPSHNISAMHNATRQPDPMTTSVYQQHSNGNAAVSSCLDEPNFAFDGQANKVPKPTYRVLEDPFEADMARGNRPTATEVLEGARETFDKFWSKPH